MLTLTNEIYGTYFHLPHCYIAVCSKYAIVYYMSKCLPQEKKNRQNKNYCTNTEFALLIFVVTHKGSNIVKYYYNLQVFE